MTTAHKSTTWVLIADQVHATLYRVRGGVWAEIRKWRSDRTGAIEARAGDEQRMRMVEFPRARLRTMAKPAWARRDLQDLLIKRMVTDIGALLRRRVCDRLVIAAPPRALAALRFPFETLVSRVATTELAVDLTRVPLHELPQRLGRVGLSDTAETDERSSAA